MSGSKYLIDVLAGAALVAALLLVVAVDFLLNPRVAAGENTLTVTVKEEESRDPKRLKLAITPTDSDFNPLTKQKELWDDMGKLLNELGEGYRYDEVRPEDLLADPKLLDPYDVLFLTCHRGGEELKDLLRSFVARGGILYASDWRYDAVAAAFPDVVDPRTRARGAPQQFDAKIVDPALREIIGPTIALKFDLGDWKTAAFAGPRVKTLIRGKYLKQKQIGKPQEQGDAPLLVKFTFGKGTVIFTSFHNEKQNSAVEKKLLQYLVFSLVTADIEAGVNDTMTKRGFTPQRSNLLSAPRNAAIHKEFENAHRSTLRFVLGFRNEGAKLRLHIESPEKAANGQNKQFTWEGKTTVIVEVPNAAQGTWKYSVTALDLPYENFPFTVTVGEKK